MSDRLLVVFTIETDDFHDTVKAINAIDAKNIPGVVGGGITLLKDDAADRILVAIQEILDE